MNSRYEAILYLVWFSCGNCGAIPRELISGELTKTIHGKEGDYLTNVFIIFHTEFLLLLLLLLLSVKSFSCPE